MKSPDKSILWIILWRHFMLQLIHIGCAYNLLQEVKTHWELQRFTAQFASKGEWNYRELNKLH
jgi:hypothetical protein